MDISDEMTKQEIEEAGVMKTGEKILYKVDPDTFEMKRFEFNTFGVGPGGMNMDELGYFAIESEAADWFFRKAADNYLEVERTAVKLIDDARRLRNMAAEIVRRYE